MSPTALLHGVKMIEWDHYSTHEMPILLKAEHCFCLDHLFVLLAMIPEIWTGRGFGEMNFGSGVGLEVGGGLKVWKRRWWRITGKLSMILV
jgi:hypothetical protein